jgi:hypothetical protein
VVSFGKRLPDGVQKAIHYGGTILLGDTGPDRLCNLFDQIGLGHPILRDSLD